MDRIGPTPGPIYEAYLSNGSMDRMKMSLVGTGGSCGSPEAIHSPHTVRGAEPPYRVIDKGKLRIDLTPGVKEGAKPSCGAVSGAEPFLQGLGRVRHSYTATQLLCYTATQLHSYTATQLHCYTMDETKPSPRTNFLT